MKTLIIVASARKGSSLFIAQKIQQKSEAIDAEILQLSKHTINYCSGCLICDETHSCPIEDDMNVILEKVKSAETIVFISPARYSLLSGDAKVFIDRLNPTAVTGELEGKKFLAVAVGQTSKDEEINSVAIAADSLVSFAENAGLEVLGKFAIYDCYSETDIQENEDVEDVCANLVRLINE